MQSTASIPQRLNVSWGSVRRWRVNLEPGAREAARTPGSRRTPCAPVRVLDLGAALAVASRQPSFNRVAVA